MSHAFTEASKTLPKISTFTVLKVLLHPPAGYLSAVHSGWWPMLGKVATQNIPRDVAWHCRYGVSGHSRFCFGCDVDVVVQVESHTSEHASWTY